MKLKIYKTEDGSDSVYNPELDEVYHSKHGAINESMHVFINSGLSLVSGFEENINILEIGFGTGLNALLTLDHCLRNNLTSHYTTLEPYPLNKEVYMQLNYPDFCKVPDCKNIFLQLHQSEWEKEIEINKQFIFKKSQTGIDKYNLPLEYFDLVYFDAFAPEIQPELWKVEIFTSIYKSLKPGGILVTYAAKGQVRRDMQTAGFTMERIPGPKGKREMLRGRKT